MINAYRQSNSHRESSSLSKVKKRGYTQILYDGLNMGDPKIKEVVDYVDELSASKIVECASSFEVPTLSIISYRDINKAVIIFYLKCPLLFNVYYALKRKVRGGCFHHVCKINRDRFDTQSKAHISALDRSLLFDFCCDIRRRNCKALPHLAMIVSMSNLS